MGACICRANECVFYVNIVSVAEEVKLWILHLVGGVATTTGGLGLNPVKAGISHLNLKLICDGV